VQRLEHFDVEVVGERRVAPNAEDGDRALRQRHLIDRLDQTPYGDRLATARAQMVRADVDQRGSEVVHKPGRLGRRLPSADELDRNLLAHA